MGNTDRGSGVGLRTNTFIYATNGIDLVQTRGPNDELISSNSYLFIQPLNILIRFCCLCCMGG